MPRKIFASNANRRKSWVRSTVSSGSAITTFLLFGFFMDLAQLQQWPFARIRSLSNAVLWRVSLVQIVIIVGVMGAAWFGLPKITLIAFVVLKF